MKENKVCVIGNGTVITRNEKNQMFKEGAVVFDGNEILEVGFEEKLKKKYPSAEYIDAHNGFIMPGYINPHEHCYCAMTRGMSMPGEAPRTFIDNLEQKWWRLDAALDQAQCYYSALSYFLDSIKNGVTTVFDHHAGYGYISGSLMTIGQAAEEAGIRACLCFEVSDRAGREKAREAVRENVKWMEYTSHLDTGLLTGMMGMHASFTISDETMEEALAEIPGDFGVHIHVAESMDDVNHCMKVYKKTVIQRLADWEVLNSKAILAHSVHLTEKEIELIRRYDASVVNNPESNMNNAVGCPPSLSLVHKGILTGMGMDGFTHDFPVVWRIANALFKHQTQDINAGWSELPQMIFKGNARIASRHFARKTGVLEPHAAADIIAVDYLSPTPVTPENIDSHLLFGTNGNSVSTTICNGNILMKNRELISLDEEQILYHTRRCAERLWKSL